MSLSEISGSGSELSSRHIPDMDTLSSTSFSFQIPGTTTADDLLADDDENDFFRNAGVADVSLTLTHAPPFSPAHTSPPCIVQREDMEEPTLGLDEVRSTTPGRIADPHILSPMDNLNHKQSNKRPKLSLNIRPLIQAVQPSPTTSFPLPTQELPISTMDDQTESNHPLSESKHPAVQLPDGPETKTRPTKKKVDTKPKEQQGRKKDLLRSQRKIVEGGISKSRIATSRKTRELPSHAMAASTLPLGLTGLSAPSLPELPVLSEHPGAEALLADSSSSSIFPMTGIASRLIQYGHKYIDSFRDQIDTKVPTEKPTVNLDCPPNPTIQGPSITQKATQEREEEPSNKSIFPVKGIADSMIQHRKKYTATYLERIGTNVSTEKVSLDSGLQPEPMNQIVSNIQKTTQERNEDDPNEADIEDERSKPLTLSQLSPRKQRIQDNAIPATLITGTDVPLPPPVRPAAKRPIMAIESASEEPKLKRSRGDDEPKPKERPPKPTVSKRKPNSKPRIPSQSQSRKPSTTRSGSGSKSSLNKSGSSVTAAAPKPAGIRRTKSRIVSFDKQAHVFNPGAGWNDNVRLSEEKDLQRSSSSSKQLSGSSLQNSRIQNESKQDDKAYIPSSSLRANQSQGAPGQTEPIPEGSNSRSTSRSHSNSQSYKHKFYHPAPNFKAIHAAFDASLAQRKENVHPTIPLPIRWETDSRMQERKKFEERVREKDREKEKEEEERRRVREAEEERELKELRKKMVVKAHEVPEWYNERPKTKRRHEQDVEN